MMNFFFLPSKYIDAYLRATNPFGIEDYFFYQIKTEQTTTTHARKTNEVVLSKREKSEKQCTQQKTRPDKNEKYQF